jgi:hypothetical protein
MLANLVADFVGGFFTDTFVGVVQSVDHGTHDFRVATAVVVVAQLIDRIFTIFGVTGGLRLVDQQGDQTRITGAARSCNFAALGFTALGLTTGVGAAIVMFAARQSVEQIALEQTATVGFASGVTASVRAAIVFLAAVEQIALEQAATVGFASGVAASVRAAIIFLAAIEQAAATVEQVALEQTATVGFAASGVAATVAASV